jgi:fumarate hydratase class II
LEFLPARNYFAAISGQDAALAVSAAMRGVSAALWKIANDLRWMNSGPVSGLGEVTLRGLQPGSSMMPGKLNPVIPEAVAMICAQVAGYDAAILIAAESGNFQLNMMLPLIGWNLLGQIGLLEKASDAMAEAVAGFTVNRKRLEEMTERNAILVTALVPRVGYDACAKIVQESQATGRSVKEVAMEKTKLGAEELDRLLDVSRMTRNEM